MIDTYDAIVERLKFAINTIFSDIRDENDLYLQYIYDHPICIYPRFYVYKTNKKLELVKIDRVIKILNETLAGYAELSNIQVETKDDVEIYSIMLKVNKDFLALAGLIRILG